MREFDFSLSLRLSDLALARRLLDLVTDPLFERFEGDIVPSLCDAELILDCTVEAEDAQGAARKVWDFVQPLLEGELEGMLKGESETGTVHGLDPHIDIPYSGLIAA